MIGSKKISVVMPVYNSEKYLSEAIESILNQTFQNFEFIIVDDKSTDSSWQIIQEYAQKDQRIVPVKNTGKKGCYSARNFGLSLAKGKYYAVMDSDDISLLNRLEVQFEFMEQNQDVVVCGAWAESFGESSGLKKTPVLNESIVANLFFNSCIAHPTAFIRNDVLKSNNIYYKDSINVAQDYEFWNRLKKFGKLTNIPEVLLKYRIHDSQISSLKMKKQDEVAYLIRTNQIKELGWNLKEKEIELHNLINDETTTPEVCHLIRAIFLMIKIFKENKKYKNFDEMLLYDIILNRYDFALNKSNVFGKKIYRFILVLFFGCLSE